MVRLILQVLREGCVTTARGAVTLGRGLLVYVGFGAGEKQSDIDWALRKTLSMCLWDDESGARPWRRSLAEIGGDIAFVYDPNAAAATDGDAPARGGCMDDSAARTAYERLVAAAAAAYCAERVHAVPFGERADIRFVNDGPITIDVDSLRKK